MHSTQGRAGLGVQGGSDSRAVPSGQLLDTQALATLLGAGIAPPGPNVHAAACSIHLHGCLTAVGNS